MLDAWERESPGRDRNHRPRAGRHPAVAVERSEAVRFPCARARAATRRCPMRTRGWPIARPGDDNDHDQDTARAVHSLLLAGFLMFFRNLTLFRFPTSLDLSDLDTHLEQTRAQAGRRAGTVLARLHLALRPRRRSAVASHRRCALAHRRRRGQAAAGAGGQRPARARSSPRSNSKEGRKPGGRTRKRLKEDLVHELLPRAFVRPSRTDALLDLEHGLCIVDTSVAQDRRKRRSAKSATRSAASPRCRSMPKSRRARC